MDAPFTPSPLAPRASMLAVASVLAAPALLVLGTVLKATTHHRALGGTTFAVLAFGVLAGCLAFGARASTLVGRWAARDARRARMVAGASAVTVVAVLGALFLVGARTPAPRGPAADDAREQSP